MDDEAFDRIYEAGAQSGHSKRIAELEAALAASAARIEAARGYLQTIVDTTAKTGTASGKWHEACVSIAKRGLAALDAAPRSDAKPLPPGDYTIDSNGGIKPIARTIDDEVKP